MRHFFDKKSSAQLINLLPRIQYEKVIAIDIETVPDKPDNVGQGVELAKFGLSVISPITHVALYTEKLGSIVIDLTDLSDYVYRYELLPLSDDRVKFLRAVLGREDYTLVGHNVLFDIRSLFLHCSISTVPRHVWDTMTFDVRLTLVNPERREELSLIKTAARHSVVTDSDNRLQEAMKPYRSKLHRIAEELENHSCNLWEFVGGYDPSADKTELATELITRYVAADAELSFRIKEKQYAIAKSATQGDTWVLNNSIKLYRWPEALDLIEFWQRLLSVQSSTMLRGLPFNRKYAETILKESTEKRERMAKEMYNATPKLMTNFVGVEKAINIVSTLFLLEMLVDFLNGKPYSASVFERPNFNFLPFGERAIRKLLKCNSCESDVDLDALAKILAEIISNTVENNSLLIKRYNAKTRLTGFFKKGIQVSIVEYIASMWFSHLDDGFEKSYVAKATYNYFKEILKLRVPVQDYLIDLPRKKAFQIYYVFVVAGVKLPKESMLRRHKTLLTTKGLGILSNGGDISHIYENGCLSMSKHALATYLEIYGDDEYINYFKIYHAEDATITRVQEWYDHARLTNRVHSILIPVTRTGRDSSSLPNMQNIDTEHYKGLFSFNEVTDPQNTYALVEIDYSNAENKTGAVISGDDNFARATEQSDFHTEMAKVYFADIWDTLTIEQKKEYRRKGKAITFGTAYGMGVAKLAETLEISRDEALEILASKAKAFPLVEKRKEESVTLINTRYKQNYIPFLRLFDGSRVRVDLDQNGGGAYKGWNYLQQGSVAAMIHHAMVEIEDYLSKCDTKTRVILNIHDSLILSVHKDDWGRKDILPKILEIMWEVFPIQFRLRTTPRIHFVCDISPENAFKWGYNPYREYPFPLDEFVTRWGFFKLPEDQLALPPEKREAPTWLGPVHEGWTLENEMAADRHTHELLREADKEERKSVDKSTLLAHVVSHVQKSYYEYFIKHLQPIFSDNVYYRKREDGTVKEMIIVDVDSQLRYMMTMTMRGIHDKIDNLYGIFSHLYKLAVDNKDDLVLQNFLESWKEFYENLGKVIEERNKEKDSLDDTEKGDIGL